MNSEETDPALVASHLRHALDLMSMENKRTQAELDHYKDLANHRLQALEDARKDHEDRLRALQDSATQFKFLVSLAAGGGLLSIIALIKSLIAP
jgi:hypothetical protein